MFDVLIWDYDGTLADSLVKNYHVTLDMLRRAVPRLAENLPAALQSPDTFAQALKQHENWREMYRLSYGMTPDEVELAGSYWAACQRDNTMVPSLFDGMDSLLRELGGQRMAIVSQNSSEQIASVLSDKGLSGCFDDICGYTDVPRLSPKPSPVPFLRCADRLSVDAEKDAIVYIGDHEEDVMFVRNIRRYYAELGQKINITSVAVSYSGSEPLSWAIRPDAVADSVEALRELLYSY